MLLEPGKKMELETGFHMAAHAAKKANQSHFEFQGKKYPVTAKSHTEGMVPPEKIGGQIYKKRDDKAAASGHSADVREEEKKFDPLKHIKSPTQGEKNAAKDVKRGSYADRAALLRSAQADGRLKEETLDELNKDTLYSYANKANKDISNKHKELGTQIKAGKSVEANKTSMKISHRDQGLDRAETRLNREEKDIDKDDDSMYTTKSQAKKIADKEAAKEVHKHEKHLHKGSKETKFDEERHMTGNEKENRERIVKSMKKGMAGFKERYGNRAKNVMYATATKQAMHHEEVDLDEAINDNLHPAGAALLKHIKPQHHNLYKPHLTTDVFNGSYKDRTDVLNAAKKAGHLKEEVDLTEAKSDYELYHPQYSGAVSHALSHHGSKGLTVHDDDYFHHVSVGPRKPSEGQTVTHHIPATDKKGNKHFIHMQVYNRGSSHKPYELNTYSSQVPKHHLKKEDIGGISTMSEDQKSVRIEPNEDMKTKTVDTLKGRVKVPAEYHNQPLSYKVKLNVEEKTTPMELAKELARKSFKKMRTEVMGKTGTSEEKKHD